MKLYHSSDHQAFHVHGHSYERVNADDASPCQIEIPDKYAEDIAVAFRDGWVGRPDQAPKSYDEAEADRKAEQEGSAAIGHFGRELANLVQQGRLAAAAAPTAAPAPRRTAKPRAARKA